MNIFVLAFGLFLIASTVQVLNTAAALLVTGHVSNFSEGVALAQETHRSGKGINTLASWIAFSNVS